MLFKIIYIDTFVITGFKVKSWSKKYFFIDVSIIIIPSKFIILHLVFPKWSLIKDLTMTTVYTGDKLKINKYYEHTEIIWIILNFKAANSLMQRICIQCGCVCLCEGGEGGRG